MDAKELGKRIKNARLLAGMTQVELGEKIGITKQAIYKYETGEAIPSAVKIAEIASALGMSADTILSGTFMVTRLRQLVKDKQITIDELAKVAKTDWEHASRWVRDIESPTEEQLAAIAKYLKTEPDELISCIRSTHEQKSYLYGRLQGAFEKIKKTNKKIKLSKSEWMAIENILVQYPRLNKKHPGRYLKMCIKRYWEMCEGFKVSNDDITLESIRKYTETIDPSRDTITWERIQEYVDALGPDALEYDVMLTELSLYGAALERQCE